MNQEMLLKRQYLEEKLHDGMYISQHSKIRLIVDKILEVLNKNFNETSSIKLYARGRCITKCIKVAEVVKQLLPQIKLKIELGSTKVSLQYGIKDKDGTVKASSFRNTDGFSSTICIVLSNDKEEDKGTEVTSNPFDNQVVKDEKIELKDKKTRKSKKKSIFDF